MKNQKLKIILPGSFLVGLLAYWTIGVYTHAHAQQQLTVQGLTITPPNIAVKMSPGDAKEGTLGLINESDQLMTFGTGVFDFVVNDDEGTPQVLPQGVVLNNKYSAASWLAVYPPQFTIKPHERINLTYYMQVPVNASAGGHYAAIVFQPLSKGSAQGSGASIQTQVATLVYFTIKGTIKEGAEVTRFSAPQFQEYGPVQVTTQIKNGGDIHINPQGAVTVKNMFGHIVDVVSLPTRNIFPGNVSLIYRTSVGKQLMMGRYTATLLASYGTGNNLPLTATVEFWVFPWKIALIIILILAASILGYIYWKRRNREQSPDQGEKEQTPYPTENLGK